METVEVLRKARALISTPDKWCQGNYRDGDAYCAMGAVYEVRPGSDADRVRSALMDATGGLTVGYYNDSHTHAEVLELFDRAIARLEEQAA